MRGDHQSNGAAESTLQQLRLKAGILINQIEEAVAGGRIIFPCTHPLYNWALLHAGWLHNRYVVSGGTTAFERSADRVYTGRLCMFGEVVLGYIKTSRKAAPRWTKGIWVGKALPNDGHIIIHAEGVFVTRSVRRLPTPFVLYSKNLSPPLAVGMPMIDVDAEHVITYAKTHAGSDSDCEDPLEAGNEADTAKVSDVAATAPTNVPMNVVALQTLTNVVRETALFSLVAPKSNVLEMINLQLQGMILLVSEPRRHRGLRSLQINSECSK